MKRYFLLVAAIIALHVTTVGAAPPRGGGGGRGGGGMPARGPAMGGGGGRPAPRTSAPSIARPAPSFQQRPMTRPQQPISRPMQPITRSQQPISRPMQPITRSQQPISRPMQPITRSQQPISRPMQPITRSQQPITRPNQPMTRPITPQPGVRPTQPIPRPTQPISPSLRPGLVPGTRPTQPKGPVTPQPGVRPTQPITRPTQPISPAVRPGLVPGSRPGITRPDRPQTFPPRAGDRPITRPAPPFRGYDRAGVRPPISSSSNHRKQHGGGGQANWHHQSNYNFTNNAWVGHQNGRHYWNHWHSGIYNPYYGRPIYGRPYSNWYGRWYHGSWGHWNCYPSWWTLGAFATAGWLFGSAVDYYNPYYVVPTEATTYVYNYSQPLPVPDTVYVEPQVPAESYVNTPAGVATTPLTPAPVAAEKRGEAPPGASDPKVIEANRYFDTSRDQFKVGNYAAARATVDQAIKQLPGDAVLHEFRALTFFAEKRYQDAAGVLYPVLAAGPGWDWETLKGLYPDTAIYASQLKELKQFVEANPQDAPSRFLLAYHSLVLDEKPTAIKLLKEVVALNPKDQLSAEILKALTQPQATPTDRPRINP